MADLYNLRTYRGQMMPVDQLEGGGGYSREQPQSVARDMNKQTQNQFKQDIATNQAAMNQLQAERDKRAAAMDAMPVADRRINALYRHQAGVRDFNNNLTQKENLRNMRDMFGVPGNTKQRNQMLIDEGSGRLMTPADRERALIRGRIDEAAANNPVPPPSPVSFGSGAGVIPGENGYTYYEPTPQPDPRGSMPVVVPPDAVAIAPGAAAGSAPVFDNRRPQPPNTATPFTISTPDGLKTVPGVFRGPDGKIIDLRTKGLDGSYGEPEMVDLNGDGVISASEQAAAAQSQAAPAQGAPQRGPAVAKRARPDGKIEYRDANGNTWVE